MMMALGVFVFSLRTAAYQELERQTAWRHASTARIGASPARQFLGRGDDTITLQGSIMAGLTGKQASLDILREMADTGDAWTLIEGTGRIYGLWVIESLKETRSVFFKDGTARRIDFSLTLQRIEDGRIDRLGSISGFVSGLIRSFV